MFSIICDWFDHRSGYRKFVSVMLLEHVPGGAKWRYIWGSMLAFVFGIQLITGVLLMTSYSPGDSTAWGSVYFIQYEMQFGWLIRGLHHFGSQTMVVLLGIHMLQVVIAGAQLPPREINWWLGLALMGVVLGLSLTGYLLPWDQKGYWATQVATSIAGSLPGPGSFIKRIIVGGPEYGSQTLSRFYTLHVGILPPLLIVLLVMHIVLFRRHGVTAPKDAKGEGLFWPDQAFKDMVGCMVLFGLLLVIVIWGAQGNTLEGASVLAPDDSDPEWFRTAAYWGRHGGGANLDAPADPGEPYPARPEWYFLFLFQLLKYFKEDTAIVGTVLIPNGVGVLLFLLPLFGFGRMRPLGHVLGVLAVVGILAGAGILTCLALADDMEDPIGRHLLTEVAFTAVPLIAGVLLVQLGLMALLRRGGLRSVVYVGGVCVLAVLLFGTGSLIYGAMSDRLLPEVREQVAAQARLNDADVKEASAKIYQFRHQLHIADENAHRAVQLAHQGIPPEGAVLLLQRDPMTRGKMLFKQHCNACHRLGDIFPSGGGTASDLGGFASPDPKKRQDWIRGLLEHPEDNKYFGYTKLEGMKNWSARMHKTRDKMSGPDRQKYNEWLDTVSEWLASRPTAGAPPADQNNAFAKGYRAFFDDDKKGYCSGCHGYAKEGSGSAPDLTGYGSADWVRLMVMAPGSKLRHGKENQMPAFRSEDGPGNEVHLLEFKHFDAADTPVIQLTAVERELIIRFLLQDDRLVFFGRPVSGPAKKSQSTKE